MPAASSATTATRHWQATWRDKWVKKPMEYLNAEVAAKIEDAVGGAARLVDRLDDDPGYLDGFASGVDRARSSHFHTSL